MSVQIRPTNGAAKAPTAYPVPSAWSRWHHARQHMGDVLAQLANEGALSPLAARLMESQLGSISCALIEWDEAHKRHAEEQEALNNGHLGFAVAE